MTGFIEHVHSQEIAWRSSGHRESRSRARLASLPSQMHGAGSQMIVLPLPLATCLCTKYIAVSATSEVPTTM